MSSEGSYPTRSSRRAEREPQTQRASAGTAAAVLILAALLGFGGGALAGNAGGGEEPVAEVSPDPGTDGTEDADAQEPDEPEETAVDNGILLSSNQAGGEVQQGESGCTDDDSSGCKIEIEGNINPPRAGVSLTVERSLDGGATWEPFATSVTVETDNDGYFSTYFWSGRAGENQFRVVGNDTDADIVSNTVSVTVVGS